MVQQGGVICGAPKTLLYSCIAMFLAPYMYTPFCCTSADPKPIPTFLHGGPGHEFTPVSKSSPAVSDLSREA